MEWILDLKLGHEGSSVFLVNHQLIIWSLYFFSTGFIWLNNLWISKQAKYEKVISNVKILYKIVSIFIITLYVNDFYALWIPVTEVAQNLNLAAHGHIHKDFGTIFFNNIF